MSRIECEGNLTVRTIVTIANALEVNAADFWKEPEPDPPSQEEKRARGRPRKAR